LEGYRAQEIPDPAERKSSKPTTTKINISGISHHFFSSMANRRNSLKNRVMSFVTK
jgi:hypothetical protein